MQRHSFPFSAGLALALGAMLLAIPACGGKKDAPPPETESPASTAPSAPAAPAAPTQAPPPSVTPPAPTTPMPDPAAVAARVNGAPITERQVWGLAGIQLMQLRSRGERILFSQVNGTSRAGSEPLLYCSSSSSQPAAASVPTV